MIRQEVLMLFVQGTKKILTPLSKEEIEQVENSIFDLAFDLELESGIVINPVLENEAHYRYWLGALPFYDNVEKEGIVIG